MKKFLHSFWVLASILCIVFYSPQMAHSNQDGAPVGKTGSPGDGGSTCASCHGGGASAGADDAFEIFASDGETIYEEGETYSFTVAATSNSSNTFGFELKVEDNIGNSIGDIVLTDPTNTQLIGGGNYITQTNAGSIGELFVEVGLIINSWEFEWQAPSDFEGEVTFYAAGNISNANSATGGDVILTNSLSIDIVSEGGGTGADIGCTNSTASNFDPSAIEDDGSCEFNIASVSEAIACGGVFLDSGGASGAYNNSENQTITIYPVGEEEFVSLTFNSFALEGCCDYVTIYDGESISSPVLQPGSNGTSLNGEIFYASPTNESGALTITFTSDGSVTNTGWEAEIGCTTYGPCFGFDATIAATYESVIGASDASAYANITLGTAPFEYLWSTGATTETIEGLTAGSYSLTITDTMDCSVSTNFIVIVDPEEYTIDELDVITTCGGTMYDSGGASGDYVNGENEQITIYPEVDGEFVSLYFASFQLESCCDYVTIYDGESTSAPILVPGSNGTSLNGQTYYASPTNESGALTVTFTSDGSVTYPGWAAEIGCTTYGPCFGFDVDVIASFESVEGANDATATLNVTLGNEPFEYLWSTGETTESIENLTTGTYSITITDSEDCTTETTFDVIVDPEEYIMGEIINVSTCNGLFYDSGGADDWYTESEDLFIRICPDEEGAAAQLEFTEFDLSWTGTMTIYDGMGTSNPILTTGTGTNLLGQTIVASEDNSTGCLTITFESNMWGGATGWEAYISCYDYIVYGCMDSEAFNYDDEAEEDDGSCYYDPGCTDPTYVEYHTQGFVADYDDGSCIEFLVDDCTDPVALNYNPEASFNLGDDPCVYNLEDWICGMHYKDARDGYSYPTVTIGSQCWMTENIRFLPEGSSEVPVPAGGVASQLEDGFVYTGEGDYALEENGRYYTWNSAEAAIPYAWHLPSAQEFQLLLEDNDGLDLQMAGSTGFEAQMSGGAILPTGVIEYLNSGNTNWLWTSNEVDEGLAVSATLILGTMAVGVEPMPKEFAVSIRALFGFPDDAILGCTDEDYIEFDETANYDDGTCLTLAIEGCTDETALNFDPIATVDDDSCIPTIEGCMDEEFAEFDENVTLDDGSCVTPAVHGCTDETAQNFDELANVDDGSCVAHIPGCTDSEFAEYDAVATLDDGTCETPAIFGCMDATAFNYNSAANVDDGTCVGHIEGCTDSNFTEFNGQANVDDGSCMTPVILGCTIDYALNYDPLANTDDGSCEVEGCTNDAFVEYDMNANIDNGTCSVIAIWGCMDELYLEYFPPANMDDGSCVNMTVEGCTDPLFLEYFAEANLDDGSCMTPVVVGCTDPNFMEFNPLAAVDDNTCVTPVVLGCMDNTYLEYNEDVNTDDGSCATPVVYGCMDPTFIEFNPNANIEDGSCTYIVLEGCMDENYTEFNPNANVDNSSCETLVLFGCIDALAFNYDALANTDDGSCIPVLEGCLDDNFVEYNPNANTEDATLCITDVVLGCTDTEAFNYNLDANTDDGSCILYFAEILYEGFAEGVVEFTPNVFGMGLDYQTYWSFGDGFYSSDYSPIHTYTANDSMEVILTVNNGEVEIVTSIWIEIINATVGVDELENDKQIIQIRYYDLMGREVTLEQLTNHQIHLQSILYDDGSRKYYKRINIR
jgi:uncharacterized protein (TIGR02145 family)